jgi:hypothetical protein
LNPQWPGEGTQYRVASKSVVGEDHPVDHVFATGTLSDEEKIAILGGNADRLFGFGERRTDDAGQIKKG